MTNKLLSYLPNYYRTSKIITNLTTSQALELQEFLSEIECTFNQFFVDLADSSLERWEKDLGIEVNNSKSNDSRRSMIKSKLRGHGTVTVKLINNVSESFSSGEVEVIEDNSSYSFTIKFVGRRGQPPNFEDLKKAIEEIKPAHLAVDYEFTYTTWAELKTLNWEALKQLTWKEVTILEVI